MSIPTNLLNKPIALEHWLQELKRLAPVEAAYARNLHKKKSKKSSLPTKKNHPKNQNHK